MNGATATTFKRVLDVLSDGDWHAKEELEEVSYFPHEWIKELELSGYTVDEQDEGRFRLRPELAATSY